MNARATWQIVSAIFGAPRRCGAAAIRRAPQRSISIASSSRPSPRVGCGLIGPRSGRAPRAPAEPGRVRRGVTAPDVRDAEVEAESVHRRSPICLPLCTLSGMRLADTGAFKGRTGSPAPWAAPRRLVISWRRSSVPLPQAAAVIDAEQDAVGDADEAQRLAGRAQDGVLGGADRMRDADDLAVVLEPLGDCAGRRR